MSVQRPINTSVNVLVTATCNSFLIGWQTLEDIDDNPRQTNNNKIWEKSLGITQVFLLIITIHLGTTLKQWHNMGISRFKLFFVWKIVRRNSFFKNQLPQVQVRASFNSYDFATLWTTINQLGSLFSWPEFWFSMPIVRLVHTATAESGHAFKSTLNLEKICLYWIT